MKAQRTILPALALAALIGAPAAHAGTIHASDANGDAFTNASSANLGQAVGTSGWYYNNVRAGATIGVSGEYARSGNGSVHFAAPAGAKADIEYLPGAVAVNGNYASTVSLGAFSTLGSMSYDWYRAGSSGATAHLHPSLRVLIDRDGDLTTTNDRGGLVFERAYNNGTQPSPVDQWISDVVGASTKVWNFGLGLGNEYNLNGNGAYGSNLADWQAFMGNAVVIGFSSGVGSGWGAFDGAVDNIAWTLGGITTTSNFELAAVDVPEPATAGLLLLGLAGLAAGRRRRAS